MGLLGGLLGWIRKPASKAPPARPLPVARNVTPPPAAKPVAAPPVDPKQAEREKELHDLRHSFRAGILDARFKDLDVDVRFVEEFGKQVAAGAVEFVVPPAAAFDVMRIVDDPNYPVKKVAAAISCDPTIAGAVVSLANSPLHRGDHAVETLPDAIVRLGARHLRLLLLEIALGSTRVKAKPYETFSTLTWKHSLLSAQLAYGVAKLAGEDGDHAYMAGLFHDVGTFAVLSAGRKLATKQDRRLTSQTLLKLIDAHAHALDEKVISGWRLPEPVAAAVIHRREPRQSVHDSRLAAVTALANDLGRPLGAWIPQRAIDFAAHPSVELLKLDAARLPDEKSILDLALKIEKVASIH